MTKASHTNPERPILTKAQLRRLSTFLTDNGRIDVKGLLADYHGMVDEMRALAFLKRHGIKVGIEQKDAGDAPG